MKYLILMFLTFNVQAKYNIDIIPNDATWAQMQIKGDDQTQANEKLDKFIKKSKAFKGNWSTSDVDSIAQRNGFDNEGNAIVEYFKPSNYTVVGTDLTASEATKKAKKDKDKLDIVALKLKISDGSAKLKDVLGYLKIKEGL